MEQGTAYIKRAVLDILIRTADAEATHHAYEDIISNALQQELGTFIENEIKRLIPDDRRIVIDSLSIDLGTITAGQTRSEFVSRFRKAFPEALLKALPETPAEPEEAELVRYFLQNGFYPWWASHAPTHNLQEQFNRLSPPAFAKLAIWILEQRQHPGLLKRLFTQLDNTTLHKLTDALTGGTLPALEQAFRQYDAFFTADRKEDNYLRWISEQLQQRTVLPATPENWERLYIEYKRLEMPGANTETSIDVLLKKAAREKSADAIPETRIALLREMLQQETVSSGEQTKTGTDALLEMFRYFFREGSLPPGIAVQQESFITSLLKTIPLKRPLYLRILNESRTQPELLLRFFYQAGTPFRATLYAALFPAAPAGETAELFRVLYEGGMSNAADDEAMREARVLAAAAFAQLRQLPQNNGLVFAQNIRPFLPAPLPPRAAFIPALEHPALAENIKNAVTALLRLQDKQPAVTFFSSDALFLQLPADLQSEVVTHYAGNPLPLTREAFFSAAPFRSLPPGTQQKLVIHFSADVVTPAALYHSPVFHALPTEMQAALKEKLGVVPDEAALQQLPAADYLAPFPEALRQQVRELAAQVQYGTNIFYSSPEFNALPEAVRWELRALPGTAASPEKLLQQLSPSFISRFPAAVQEQLKALITLPQQKSNAFFSSAFFRKLPEQKQRTIRTAFRDYPEPVSATGFLASPAFTRLDGLLQNELIQALQQQRLQSPSDSTAEKPIPETEAAAKTTFAITDTFLSDLLQHYILNEALPWWTAPLHHHAVFRKLFTGGVAADHAAVFSEALHHFARYFPVAFARWTAAAVALPQFHEFIFARLTQPDFERVSASLFPAVWPDVPQTVKLLFPFFAGTAAQSPAETGLRDVVAALLPYAGQPAKPVMVQLLRVLATHFGKRAEEIRSLLLTQETLPAIIQQAADEWVALQENEPEATSQLQAAVNEQLRFQNASVALPLTNLLSGETMLPALTARAATADALLHELDENPELLPEMVQILRRQPELISWITNVLPAAATARFTQKLLAAESMQVQQTTNPDAPDALRLAGMRIMNDVIAETNTAAATAKQQAHARLLLELYSEEEAAQQLPETLIRNIGALLQQPVTSFQLRMAEKMLLLISESATLPAALQLLPVLAAPVAAMTEQLIARWKTEITILLQSFISLNPELDSPVAGLIANEAVQLKTEMQQQHAADEQTKRLQEHTRAVLQFVKAHLSQSSAIHETTAVSSETQQTDVITAANALQQDQAKEQQLQPDQDNTTVIQNERDTVSKDDSQSEVKNTELKKPETVAGENEITESQKPETVSSDNDIAESNQSKTVTADDVIRELKNPETVAENKIPGTQKQETALPPLLAENAVETPVPPGREALLRNPVFFINSLLYFFTWKKLPWWSPYKSADELNAYAAAVVRERQGQLNQQLQLLLENQATQHELVMFLAERLQETDFGSAALATTRLRFGLLLQVARKTDNALAAFIETSQNLLQLPVFNEPETGKPLAEKLYALLLTKLQQQNINTQELHEITADEREALLLSAGYSTSAAAAGEELAQAIAALEQQLQQVKEEPAPVADVAKINAANQTLTRQLLEQLQQVIPEAVLQQLPASFVQQLSRYPQQERRTAWLAAVFTFFALHTGRSLRDVLNPAIRLTEKQSGELHQELLALRQRPAFPYPDLLLEAELQALALQVSPGNPLPFASWHEAVNTLSSDTETQRLLLLTFAVTETARVRGETAEQVAARFNEQLHHTGPEQEQLMHTPGLLRSLREHLYLLDPENRNVYTDTILQLKNRQAEARSETPAPVAARVAAALLQQLVRDKHLLQALGEQETKKYNDPQKQKKEDEPIEYVTEKPAEGDPIYVFNAGLVLLWPFIGGLFRRLGYVSGKTFVSQEKRERAILLLQFVIDEQHTHPPEHLLPLNKLLCGMHPTDPIEHMADLDETEKQEAVAFLAAVKAQWEQMKNTSVDTFRRTFLKREGALVYKNDNWELQVQHVAVDVLLKKLPWGVSTVKFAWTPTILFVKWKI